MTTGTHTIQSLLGEALRDTTDLAQKEFALFRTEMNQNIRMLFTGIAMVVVAAVFAIAALVLFTKALVDWLATVVHSEALSALIVGGIMLLIAIAAALYARHAVSKFSITPARTIRSIKRDAEVLAERVS